MNAGDEDGSGCLLVDDGGRGVKDITGTIADDDVGSLQ